MKSKVLKGFWSLNLFWNNFRKHMTFEEGVLEIKPFYKLFPNRLFGQKMFSNCGYVEFEIILMKMFCNWFLQDFSSQVVLKFCLNNEGGWVAKLLNSRVDRVFEKQGKINASLENEIFWKPLFYKSNAPYFFEWFQIEILWIPF
jgi:hypothetical protein